MRLTIESLAYGGAAIAHAEDGVTVFVEGACPGDTVEADITEDHGRFRRATVVEIVEPSADRVQPLCPYFGRCGGCQWQHIDLGVQRDSKQRFVADALERIGNAEVDVSPTLFAAAGYGYRNKVELSVVDTSRGTALGLARRHSNEILPIESCPLLSGRSQRVPHALTGALRYLASQSDTPVERLGYRVSTTSSTEVSLWTKPGPFPRHLAAKVFSDAVGAKTITRVLFKGPIKARSVVKVEVLAGPGMWEERLGKDRFMVSAPSFFQVNTAAAMILRDAAIAALDIQPADRVFDVFSGVGTFTLPIARAAGAVTAIESYGSAISDLRRNLDVASLSAKVAPGDAARALPECGDADLVIVDPPRSGLAPAVIEALAQAHPRRIVYVSCDAGTLGRDTARFSDAGYLPKHAVPVDLFPQTYHIETVLTLEAR